MKVNPKLSESIFPKAFSILIVGPSMPTNGIIPTWISYMIPELQFRDWSVVLGLVTGRRYHKPEKFLKKNSIRNAFSIPYEKGNEEGRRKAISKAILQVKPDIVISVNLPDVVASVAELRIKGESKSRAVYVKLGNSPRVYSDIFYLRKSADEFVSNDELSCQLLHDVSKVEENRISHVRYGVKIEKKQDRKRLNQIRIGCIERFTFDPLMSTQLSDIVRILKQEKLKFEFQIASDNPSRSSLRKLPNFSSSEAKIEFRGLDNSKSLSESFFSDIDVILVPNSWDNDPFLIWEAMASDVAVVSSRFIGAMKEQKLEEGKNCLLFDIGDTKEAAHQLIRLARNEDLRKSLLKAGKATVESKYSHSISGQNFSFMLENLMDTPLQELEPVNSSIEGYDENCNDKTTSFFQWIFKTKVENGPEREWPTSLPHLPLLESISNEEALLNLAIDRDYSSPFPKHY